MPVRNRIREVRSGRGWSQGELGARLEVSRQTINAIETGRYEPSLALALKLALLFEAPVERLFEYQREG